MLKFILILSLLLFIFSCDSYQERIEESAGLDTTSMTDVHSEIKATLSWATDSVFKTPESVLFISSDSTLLVSNISGLPDEKNLKGFISQISLSGEILHLNWIEGLNAPKGMALLGNKLYVTDINDLVEIDTGRKLIINRYHVPGSKFLNDIAADTANNILYFSDSESNKIYEFRDSQVTTWMDSVLSGPNGLLVNEGYLIVAEMKKNALVAVNISTKDIELIADGLGASDGLVQTGNSGEFLVSDWNGSIFYVHDKKGKRIVSTIPEKINAADIEYIAAKNLLLVPTFFDNRVMAYHLKRE